MMDPSQKAFTDPVIEELDEIFGVESSPAPYRAKVLPFEPSKRSAKMSKRDVLFLSIFLPLVAVWFVLV